MCAVNVQIHQVGSDRLRSGWHCIPRTGNSLVAPVPLSRGRCSPTGRKLLRAWLSPLKTVRCCGGPEMQDTVHFYPWMKGSYILKCTCSTFVPKCAKRYSMGRSLGFKLLGIPSAEMTEIVPPDREHRITLDKNSHYNYTNPTSDAIITYLPCFYRHHHAALPLPPPLTVTLSNHNCCD